MTGIVFALALLASSPCADAGRAVEPPPDPPPLDTNTWYGSLYDWAGGYEAAPLGVGHLALEGREDTWDWWIKVVLPLYESPGGEASAWFVNGWLVNAPGSAGNPANPVPMGTAGMVETGYETMSFVVVERNDDGWIRFLYGKPDGHRDGTAWTHRCHVEEQGLRFESWEERFTSGEISPLHFRSDVRHALRAGPDETAERLQWIAVDHHLEPIEFRGDWMKALVTQPSDYCDGDAMETEKRGGWVRWRSQDRQGKGPWVWYFTRGC